MPYIEVDGQRLFFAHRRTTKELPPLILIHGAGGSHLDWPAELLRLPGADVHALDLPGHGRSSPPGHRTIDDYARTVLSFMETLDLRSVVLAGHSMGGAIAQTIGLHNPARLIGLVLLGTGARLRVSKAILGSIQTDPEAAVATLTRYRWGQDAAEPLIAAGHDSMRQIDPEILYGDFAACNQFDMMDQVGEIQLPTLVLSGTADMLTPAKYGLFLAQCIPGAVYREIEGCGHMVALERPEEVAATIAGFVATLR